MEGKDENKLKIVYFILAVFIHANVFLPFLSEKTGVHGAFILCDIILAIIAYNLAARNWVKTHPFLLVSNKKSIQ
jgi:hypothetical protein